jgi:hypothetical protein
MSWRRACVSHTHHPQHTTTHNTHQMATPRRDSLSFALSLFIISSHHPVARCGFFLHLFAFAFAFLSLVVVWSLFSSAVQCSAECSAVLLLLLLLLLLCYCGPTPHHTTPHTTPINGNGMLARQGGNVGRRDSLLLPWTHTRIASSTARVWCVSGESTHTPYRWQAAG